ncbi:MAG: DUF1501 domain-containing protein [Candidatus Poribacteria bacterium]|nr:DUF1501 domain-containing protein [Candidatus Poribacteria bacterium]MDE0505805.1 DUF1501 domain-containing protein [Candidatus Poribacteria bacterium]
MKTQIWVPEFEPVDTSNSGMSRRNFLKCGMSSFLGLVAMQHLQSTAWAQFEKIMPRAKGCIVLFMNGGPSQLDTFDPKPGTLNGGPFGAIPTSAGEIQFSQHLPLVAEQAHHLAVIRSMVSREGNHERARYLMHTGYAPTGSVKHPTFGSLASHYLDNEDSELPNCVNINSPSFTAGILEAKHDPFVVNDPRKPIDDLKYPEQMDRRRFEERLKMLNDLEKDFLKDRVGRSTEAHQAVYKKADKLINSPSVEAFNLSDEPIALREAYGDNRFGQGCLMARRLIEAGVKFVEVSLDGWDTHSNNFERTGNLLEVVDPAFAALVKDLADRGLLDETIVLWLGEFGRTPKINQNEGRDHFPNGWSAVIAGGGVRGGHVIGATSEDGTAVVERPVSVPDLFASLCFALGIDYNNQNYSRQGRPIRVVNDGRVVKDLFV